jgi:hypothetical protein
VAVIPLQLLVDLVLCQDRVENIDDLVLSHVSPPWSFGPTSIGRSGIKEPYKVAGAPPPV